jgi:hypothetical protein
MLSTLRDVAALFACTALSVTCLSVTRVHAHAPAEVLQIVSDKPDALILATNRGLIYGNLQTRAFSLLCNEALDVGTSAPYRTASLPSGKLLVGDSAGLRASDDRGCSFAAVPALAQLSVPDMVQDPREPKRIFVTTAGVGAGGLRVSDDEGATFKTLLSVPDDDFLGSLLLVPGAPAQLYTSAVVLHKDTPTYTYSYYVAHSSDEGQTWSKSEVALTDDERDVTLLAVNPVRPQELLARATGSEPILGERVLWSNDGGKTFSSPITLRALRTAAFSTDGKVAYVGGVDGLWSATDEARTFQQVPGTARLSTLRSQSDGLLAAGYYEGLDARQDGIGLRGPSDTGFSRWFDFVEVGEPFTCPAPSTVDARCRPLWRDWTIENPSLSAGTDADVALDAGAAASSLRDAGHATTGDALAARDAGTQAARRSDPGGCTVSPRPTSYASGLAGLLSVLGTLLASQRRAPRRVLCFAAERALRKLRRCD